MEVRKYQMTLAFRGTAYHGFQVQQNARTVCQTFQDAVEAAFGVRYPVKGCSRTDAGVHANRFVLTMDCPQTLPCGAMVRALNNRLPGDIAVLDCALAPPDFHPRYSCLGKRYIYQIWNSQVKNPFLEDLAFQVRSVIDIGLANRAAGMFLGRRDFSALCAAGGGVEDRVRTVCDCRVDRRGDLITLSVTGDGFLYNMVRILAGTVLEAAFGRLAPEEIAGVLDSRDRGRAGPTLPPHGLFLDRVFYDAGALAAECPHWQKEVVRHGADHPV